MRKRPPARPTYARLILPKAPTGIHGLDEILEGGLPRQRSTLVCGAAGSGKTLLAAEFLVRGAMEFDEPGVLIAFEETREDLTQNLASLGFPLAQLVTAKKMVLDYVHFERSEMLETGAYSLEGLFVRLEYAIDSIGAKRVAMDSLEVLFASLSDAALLRSELRRLFCWLHAKGVTSVITAERGEGTLTRHGLEEYVSDCVILLDNRVNNQFATRRLRIVKYRGSRHGMDEYPFIVGDHGISVLPITSVGLNHLTPAGRVLSGIQRLDAMLGGRGYHRGSSILISGGSGTGKTSIAAHLANSVCAAGQRCLIFLFEESPSQYIRNMRSLGLDLEPWIRCGLLLFHAARPTLCGLETHLVTMHRIAGEFKPSVVVIDPVTNLESGGTADEASSLLTRLIDFFKAKQITTLFTSLTRGGKDEETTDAGISSLMDTWILVRNVESGGERNRVLYVLKSRGMAHSNQVREFQLSDHGIELVDVYVGPGGVLTGAARLAQEAREAADLLLDEEEFARRRHEMDRSIQSLQAKSKSLALELKIAVRGRAQLGAQNGAKNKMLLANRLEMAQARRADASADDEPNPKTKQNKGA
ncbi:Circadian clock protein KaiC [Acidisarcina polymorpha]|uniref:Circadian clock protein KaiC n=1 Tax=Acidisarcina polymorpha TaxID=2211140 RepID=A0A2Z5FUX0_9BACT|nr:circadian clock protein KaiC [Acidisarcina polymorpha]AXC10668.1 Circadian clock protein KaiC [Acidisarcina polymorpha]